MTAKHYTNPKGFPLKTLLLSDALCLATDELFETETALLDNYQHGQRGKLDTMIAFGVTDVVKIEPFEAERMLLLILRPGRVIPERSTKDGRVAFAFATDADYADALTTLTAAQSFRTEQKQQTRWTKHLSDIFFPIMAAIATFITCSFARQLETGEGIRITGRRRLFQELLLNVADTLGFWGSLGAGGALTAFLAYRGYQNIRASNVVKTVYVATT